MPAPTLSDDSCVARPSIQIPQTLAMARLVCPGKFPHLPQIYLVFTQASPRSTGCKLTTAGAARALFERGCDTAWCKSVRTQG